MQATLDASSLKRENPHPQRIFYQAHSPIAFTRALTCLSRYGEDLTIAAASNSLTFSTTNQSMSAYCRFKFRRQFFSKYSVGTVPTVHLDEHGEELSQVTGQLLTKSILSVLKHTTVEKTVERCELSIVEGAEVKDGAENDEADGLESKLIIRLHCKHGVIKTHRLLLLSNPSLLAPDNPDSDEESRLTIGSRTIKEMLDHFPTAKGKADPQLIWTFGLEDVDVKSAGSIVQSKGNTTQLSTELTISTEEFEAYDVLAPPIRIAFHLREFTATTAFADSMSFPLDLRFTDPNSPLFIDVESDNFDGLFVISTSQAPVGDQIPSSQASRASRTVAAGKKRQRDESEQPRPKKPMNVVRPAAAAESRPQSRAPESMPPPSIAPPSIAPSSIPRSVQIQNQNWRAQEPLFLPGSSQESQLEASGEGLDSMSVGDLMYMMDGEGEEVAVDLSQRPSSQHYDNEDAELDMQIDSTDFDIIEDPELEATQNTDINRKTFRPLFED